MPIRNLFRNHHPLGQLVQMKRHLLTTVFLCSALTGLLAAERIEAENTHSGTPFADAQASAGNAVGSDHPWEPLLRMPAPAGELGDQVVLWIRHRGGPLQAKILTADGQKACDWHWDKPAAWSWSTFGPWDRSALTLGLVVIRGDGSDATDPAIDCAVWQTPAAAAPSEQ